MSFDQSRWKAFTKRVRLVKRIPFGYLSLNQYSKRLGITRINLMDTISRGRISEKDCVRLEMQRGSQICINWNATAYNYILGMTEKYKPKDFVKNPERLYRPIYEDDDEDEENLVVATIKKSPIVETSNSDEDIDLDNLNSSDIFDAKLKGEIIKNKIKAAELRLVENKSLTVDQVIGINREIALELKSSWQIAINGIVADLAAEFGNNPIESRNIILRHLNAISDTLMRLGNNGTTEEDREIRIS